MSQITNSQIQKIFSNHVKSVYDAQKIEQKYENLRKEFIKEFNAQSQRVKEFILSSHGALNLVHTTQFDLIQKQLWKIQNEFYDNNPSTQANIINFYMRDFK